MPGIDNPPIEVPDDLIAPELELIGIDTNAGAIIGTVRRALREAGNSREIQDSFVAQALSGDYNHLLNVAMAFVDYEFPEVT
jgi:hypothetical protein